MLRLPWRKTSAPHKDQVIELEKELRERLTEQVDEETLRKVAAQLANLRREPLT